MSNIVVSLVDVHVAMHLLLEGGATLEHVAKSLYSLFRTEDGVHRPSYCVGVICQQFQSEVHGWTKVLDDTRIYSTVERVVYSFERREVRYYKNGSPRFAGTVEEFLAKVTPETSLVGKTIVFRYTSGSAVGNRVVKVEHVEKKNGTVYYCGKDMAKDQYRRYDKRHIQGEILVLEGDKVAVA